MWQIFTVITAVWETGCCFYPWVRKLSLNKNLLLKKRIAPIGADSFLKELISIGTEEKIGNGRVASPKYIPIHLKSTKSSYHLLSISGRNHNIWQWQCKLHLVETEEIWLNFGVQHLQHLLLPSFSHTPSEWAVLLAENYNWSSILLYRYYI